VWALIAGSLIIANGLMLRKMNSMSFENLTVLFLTCLSIVLLDRLLLAIFGLPLWMADVENHYIHRPNTIRSWGSRYGNKLIRTNKYGHHDDNFPLEKKDNEFRGLIIGDSITMGHGVRYDEAYANQLERILKKQNASYSQYQIINSGVQGYSTFQEFNLLKRSLVFKPDFVAIGFCMNDLTEPFVVNKDFGGVGIDYHGITQKKSLVMSYLLNETGYGRFIQEMKKRGRSVERERRHEMYSVKQRFSH
jgi:hypothetical protein